MSILFSLQVHWSTIFMLPHKTVKHIEASLHVCGMHCRGWVLKWLGTPFVIQNDCWGLYCSSTVIEDLSPAIIRTYAITRNGGAGWFGSTPTCFLIVAGLYGQSPSLQIVFWVGGHFLSFKRVPYICFRFRLAMGKTLSSILTIGILSGYYGSALVRWLFMLCVWACSQRFVPAFWTDIGCGRRQYSWSLLKMMG